MFRFAKRPSFGSESGGTLVEAAISMSLLLLLMFGILEGGLAAYSYHYLSHAAKSGARYAIVRGSDWPSGCSDYTGAACTTNLAQVTAYIKNLGFPGIDESKIYVNLQCATLNASSQTYNAFGTYGSSCNAAGDVVQVTVSYPFSVPIVGINGTCDPSATTKFCMSTTSEMVIAN